VHGVPEPARDLRLAPEHRFRVPGRLEVEREAQDVARAEADPYLRAVRSELEGHRAGEVQRRVPGPKQDPALRRVQHWPGEPVVRPRAEDDLDVDGSLRTRHLAQQGTRGVRAQVVASLAVAEHQGVRDRDAPAGTGMGGFEDHRRPEVAPRRHVVPGGPDRPESRLWSEDPAEHRGTVEARKAEPVHGARGTHQRRRAAVGQQGIVRNRLAAHLFTMTALSWGKLSWLELSEGKGEAPSACCRWWGFDFSIVT
jgi:hypothetical protein